VIDTQSIIARKLSVKYTICKVATLQYCSAHAQAKLVRSTFRISKRLMVHLVEVWTGNKLIATQLTTKKNLQKVLRFPLLNYD